MEQHITYARDEWITEFKKKWDEHILRLADEKTTNINRLIIDYDKEVTLLENEKEQKMKNLTEAYSTKILDLKKKLSDQKLEIKIQHEKKLQVFLNSNLKQNTIYESICSYILNFRNTEKLYKEPEIVTFEEPSAPPPYECHD